MPAEADASVELQPCDGATQPVATDGGGELTTASTAAARSGGPRTGEASRRAGRRVF